MKNFMYQNGTKIIFGKETEQLIGSELKSHTNKVLLHYGGGSIKKTGLYDKVVDSLNASNIEFVELGGVEPNPRLSLVREGIKCCKKHEINFILAVGGGSVIDSAKAIAAGVRYEGDVWDLFSGTTLQKNALPIATILTIPAAGSETSTGTVVTNDETGLKRSFNHPSLRPMFSILNPELTYTLPMYQTACGIADMLAHVLERYFTNEPHVDVTDRLCEATMKAIIENGRRVMKNPMDYHIRAELMLAGMIAHNGSLDLGRSGDWASHEIEHELSGQYDIAHGAGLAIIFPAWMKYIYQHDVAKLAQFGNRVFDLDINQNSLEETALQAIHCLEQFFKDLNLPVRFSEANLPTHEIELLAQKLLSDRSSVGRFVSIDKQAAIAIYQLAL